MRVLVTGAAGSVGWALCPVLAEAHDVVGTDIDTMDVTSQPQTVEVIVRQRPDAIVHLAGAKHAPEGELQPGLTSRVNIQGTENVLRAAERVGARVVTASTCKACDPETAYGASKLIAERMTLNAGGVVVRFFNVPETIGNVFRLWETLPKSEPLPVCSAFRYFVPLEEVIQLLVAALELPSGRYIVDPGKARYMPDVAAELYPGREQIIVPLRRGDRRREPLHAASEYLEPAGQWQRVIGQHDPVPVAAAGRVAA